MSRILIVDDEINIRRVVKEYAEFEGYEVGEAANGMEAVELVKNNDYDLIVMDIMMPKLHFSFRYNICFILIKC